VLNLRDNDRNLNLDDQPHSGRSVTAADNWNKQIGDKIIEEN
jgi:hypothetical protein